MGYLIFGILFSFVADQMTKIWISDFFSSTEGAYRILIDPIFYLTFVKNTGIAFGLFRQHPQVLLFVITGSVIIFTIYCFLQKKDPSMVKLSYGLIIGGAFGNLFDRLRLGYVVDFLDFRVWPVFNFADTFITIGVGLLIIDTIFLSKKET